MPTPTPKRSDTQASPTAGKGGDPEKDDKQADRDLKKLHEKQGNAKKHGGGSPGDTPNPQQP